jgi:hypothetical protein
MKEQAMKEQTLKPCPFCGGAASLFICDDEGNTRDEPGYEDNPWSGLTFRIRHAVEENRGCPVAGYSEEGVGVYLYKSREEAARAWNRRVHRPFLRESPTDRCPNCGGATRTLRSHKGRTVFVCDRCGPINLVVEKGGAE